MKKIALLTGLVAVALFLGVAGTSLRADRAQADPESVLSINPNICIALTAGADWNNDAAITAADTLAAIAACTATGGLANPANLLALADVLNDGAGDGDGAADVDDPDLYADLAAAGADQLIEGTGTLYILAFVSNDDNVIFTADEGIFAQSGAANWTCNIAAEDNDCDAAVGTVGDGVVVAVLQGTGLDSGDRGAADLEVEQQSEFLTLEYVVVGAPDDISLAALKTTIQEGDKTAAQCDVTDFEDLIGDPDVAGLLATVTDEDGTALAGIWVAWESDDEDVVDLSVDGITTLALGDDLIAAPNLACGDEVGSATITAAVDTDADGVIDAAENTDAEIDIDVVGIPASFAVAASPSSITCNGTNTSEVSVTVKDADGNLVVAGNEVRFDVVALGIATPIVAETDANGVAKSTITPLSGVSAGVVVLISVGDLETSIRVDCAPAAPVVPPVAPPVLPPVVPPGTGDAGLLD